MGISIGLDKEDSLVGYLDKVKVKYDHWVANPYLIPEIGMDHQYLYGRVVGHTIYLSKPKEQVREKISHNNTRTLRHELEHIYQTERAGGVWRFGLSYLFEFVKTLAMTGSVDAALHANRYEREADRVKSVPLTLMELAVFMDDHE